MNYITVDDFGIGDLANERILDLVREKRVDRVSVMIHGTISREEVRELLSSEVKLDIHLDIEEVVSLKRVLRGNFMMRIFMFFRQGISGRYSKKNIERIWEGQLLQFKKKFGRFPDGLNSHQHTHFFPVFFPIIAELSKKYRIPFVRFGRERSGRWTIVACVLDFFRPWNKKVFHVLGCETTDFLVSIDWLPNFGKDVVWEGSVEKIFHPERDEEWEYLNKAP